MIRLTMLGVILYGCLVLVFMGVETFTFKDGRIGWRVWLWRVATSLWAPLCLGIVMAYAASENYLEWSRQLEQRWERR